MTRNACLNCNSTNKAEIIYGLVDMQEAEDLIENGKITLGGCNVTGNDPKWECNNCGTKWRQC